MSGSQVGMAIALAIIGFLLVVISTVGRDNIDEGSFGDHLSKAGLLIGGLFIVPLVLMLMISIVVGGFRP